MAGAISLLYACEYNLERDEYWLARGVGIQRYDGVMLRLAAEQELSRAEAAKARWPYGREALRKKSKVDVCG